MSTAPSQRSRGTKKFRNAPVFYSQRAKGAAGDSTQMYNRQPRELTALLNLQTKLDTIPPSTGPDNPLEYAHPVKDGYHHRHYHHHHRGSTTGPTPTGTIHVPRRGLFYASELLYSKDAREWDQEFPEIERVCVIRFPPEVAAILRDRLAIQLEIELLGAHEGRADEILEHEAEDRYSRTPSYNQNVEAKSKLSRGELGLTITPTSKEDYRVFDVEVERELGVPSSAILLTGVLVELPCLLEAYKSLEGDLLFKSNDVSQMLYTFDSTTGPPFDLAKIRDEQLWEWHSGLTPGTHRIRGRKFKNFRVFEKADVSITERQLSDIINQKSHQEQAVLEVLTEDVCEHHLESIHLGTLDPNVAGIIGPENPILMAALDGTSPIVAVQSGKCDEFGKALLRHLIPKGENGEREQDFATTLEEKLRFSSDPTMKVMEDEIIPDDLSDRLFGDYGIDEDDETMVEDEYQLDDVSSNLGCNVEHVNGMNATYLSSDSSSLSSDENVRKKPENSRQHPLL